jgi:hypothetical protein
MNQELLTQKMDARHDDYGDDDDWEVGFLHGTRGPDDKVKTWCPVCKCTQESIAREIVKRWNASIPRTKKGAP